LVINDEYVGHLSPFLGVTANKLEST
jgi:hypothetical protein